VTYNITFAKSAAREVERLPQEIARRALTRIDSLKLNPRPRGSVKLAGTQSTWRIRVGEYRVVYTVNDESRLVDVIRVRHRRDVYQ
jgi:mRNA interferase RelE/StbE